MTFQERLEELRQKAEELVADAKALGVPFLYWTADYSGGRFHCRASVPDSPPAPGPHIVLDALRDAAMALAPNWLADPGVILPAPVEVGNLNQIDRSDYHPVKDLTEFPNAAEDPVHDLKMAAVVSTLLIGWSNGRHKDQVVRDPATGRFLWADQVAAEAK